MSNGQNQIEGLIQSDVATLMLFNLLISYLSAQGVISRKDFIETIQTVINSEEGGTGAVPEILRTKISMLAGFPPYVN